MIKTKKCLEYICPSCSQWTINNYGKLIGSYCSEQLTTESHAKLNCVAIRIILLCLVLNVSSRRRVGLNIYPNFNEFGYFSF